MLASSRLMEAISSNLEDTSNPTKPLTVLLIALTTNTRVKSLKHLTVAVATLVGRCVNSTKTL